MRRKWPNGLIATFILVGSAIALGPDLSPAVASTAIPQISWLAAGDSYSSGQGLPYAAGQCAQGTALGSNQPGAWPIEAADSLAKSGQIRLLPGSPAMVACTGASWNEFSSPVGSLPPEWAHPDPTYDLVTFTFGGDDVGFRSVLEQCLGLSPAGLVSGATDVLGNSLGPAAALYQWAHDPMVHCPSESALRQKIRSVFDDPKSGYRRFLERVANTAVTTGGNVVVLGYPDIVEDPTLWPPIDKTLGLCQGIRPADALELRRLAGDLNSTIASIVKAVESEPSQQRNDVTFTYVDVNTGDPSQGIPYSDPNLFEPSSGPRHNLCGAKEWINGITLSLSGQGFIGDAKDIFNHSFHPNQPGNDAMARLVEQVFGHLDWNHLQTSTLAVLVNGALFLWKDGALSRIAPASLAESSGPQIVSSFEWASDGRYLGFQEQPPNSGLPDITAWYDTATRKTVSWSVSTGFGTSWSITSEGEEALQPASSPQSGATLTILHLDGTTSQQTVPVPPSDVVSGSSAGFVVGPDPFIGDGGSLEMVALDGGVTNLPSLPAASLNFPYEDQALSPDGKVFIAEQGDHTDGCGAGPPSQLFVVDVAVGSVHQVPLPIGPNWRVGSIAFDPDDTIDATMINCGTSNNTVVFMISPLGTIKSSTPGALSMTSDGGLVAAQVGGESWQTDNGNPYVVPTPSGPVTINGQAVPGTASAAASIAWAP